MEGLMPSRGGVVHGLRETAEMIKLQHTVFALPFAVISLITATGRGWPPARVWFWVLVAMVAARTAAMTFNRIVDEGIDAANPRTASRALPAGRLSRRFAWGVLVASSALFFVAAGALNPLCLTLAAPALAVLLGYSYTKRFTALAHLWLGVALGISPVGAWAAATGRLAVQPMILGLGVMLWVAGFDVIYSLQDEAFDREHGLHSIPVAVGAAGALRVSRLLHAGAVVCFLAFALMAGGGPWRLAAVASAAALLLWQHRIVRPDDFSRVDAAFFSANGTLALLMCGLFVFAKIAGGP